MLFSFFLVIGATFGFLAALIAFFITYREYSRHKFEGWALWREALTVAFFTYAFFLGIAFCIGYVLG